jgi:hypothetical protein
MYSEMQKSTFVMAVISFNKSAKQCPLIGSKQFRFPAGLVVVSFFDKAKPSSLFIPEKIGKSGGNHFCAMVLQPSAPFVVFVRWFSIAHNGDPYELFLARQHSYYFGDMPVSFAALRAADRNYNRQRALQQPPGMSVKRSDSNRQLFVDLVRVDRKP